MSELAKSLSTLKKSFSGLQRSGRQLADCKELLDTRLETIQEADDNMRRVISGIAAKFAQSQKGVLEIGVTLEAEFVGLNTDIVELKKVLRGQGAGLAGKHRALVEEAKALLEALQSAAKKVRGLESGLGALLDDAADEIAEDIASIDNDLKELFEEGFASLESTFDSLAEKAGEIIKEGIDTATDAIPSLLDGTVEKIIENIIDAVTLILESSMELTTICQSLSTAISPYLPQLVAIRELAKAVRELLEMARAGL
ncbi:MAG: hypothetical protein KAH44_05860 [Oricola sp.]|jgi:chromosome segregation ATPase|nr:hypothetical protein [Oricola sp.]